MSPAPNRDTVEFASALLIGVLIGGGAALLTGPERAPKGKRLFTGGCRSKGPSLLRRLGKAGSARWSR